MTIYELSRALGEALRDQEITQEALAARAAYEADAEAKGLLESYQKKQNEYNALMSRSDADEAATEALGQEIRDISRAIHESPVITRLLRSEDTFNEMVRGVFGIINATITGEEPGCGGSCDSCAGCH